MSQISSGGGDGVPASTSNIRRDVEAGNIRPDWRNSSDLTWLEHGVNEGREGVSRAWVCLPTKWGGLEEGHQNLRAPEF